MFADDLVWEQVSLVTFGLNLEGDQFIVGTVPQGDVQVGSDILQILWQLVHADEPVADCLLDDLGPLRFCYRT